MPAPRSALNLSAILEQSADAIIYADREGNICLWNLAAERLFGFEAGEAVGQSLDLIIPERLRARHWAGYHQAISSGQTIHSGQPMLTKALHRLGEMRYVEMSFAVVTDALEGVVGSVAIARAANPPVR